LLFCTARIECQASIWLMLRQLSDDYDNSVATRRERRTYLQRMWTLLQTARRQSRSVIRYKLLF